MDVKPTTASFSPKSGKELAKAEKSDAPAPSSTKRGTAEGSQKASVRYGKGTSKHWERKVYRPAWCEPDGPYRQVANFFVRIMVAGRREAVALNTADRLKAARKAALLYERIRVAGWDTALREFDPERHTPKSDLTVGDAIAAINRTDTRKTTKANYVNALRWFAARQVGYAASKKTFGPAGSEAYRKTVESVRLSDLSTENVQAVIDTHLQAAGTDANAQRSARISVASFLRNARAGLKKAEALGVSLPHAQPFAGIKKPEGGTAPTYVSTFDVGKLLRKAKKELTTDPPVYSALLLALGAGLRRGEIRNLCWRRVDRERNRVLVLATGGWSPKTGESEQAIHVDGTLLAELEPFRAGPDDLVTTPTALDRAVAWLRVNGVNANKPIHTLRKEFGSIIAESADLFTASRALRHSSLSVTASVYVENRKRVAPDIGAMLGPVDKSKNAPP